MPDSLVLGGLIRHRLALSFLPYDGERADVLDWPNGQNTQTSDNVLAALKATERRECSLRRVSQVADHRVQASLNWDAEQDLRTTLGVCRQLGYSDEQVQAMFEDVAQSYQADGGQTLLQEAFKHL